MREFEDSIENCNLLELQKCEENFTIFSPEGMIDLYDNLHNLMLYDNFTSIYLCNPFAFVIAKYGSNVLVDAHAVPESSEGDNENGLIMKYKSLNCMLICSWIWKRLKEGPSKDNEFQSLSLFETNDSSMLSDCDEFIIHDEHKGDVGMVEFRKLGLNGQQQTHLLILFLDKME